MAVHFVCYAGIARPGHSYSMSDSHWVNTGTARETLVFRVDPPGGTSWIKMAESSITLDPGQAASIPVTLTVPAGAVKGIYGARLVASGAEENVEFGVGMPANCTGPSAPPIVPEASVKGGSGLFIPLGIMGGLLISVILLGVRWRRGISHCDDPVHGPRRSKWRSLTPQDMR
jgi:hypothetical protein